MKDNIISIAASDYDMSENEVRHIYDTWYDKGLFYQKLEEFIEIRSNN